VLYSDIVLLAAIVLKPETICRYYPKSKIADAASVTTDTLNNNYNCKMPPRCRQDEGRLEEVSMCALRTCEPLACTAGYLRSLAIRRLAMTRK
jgi:hypothetical protein